MSCFKVAKADTPNQAMGAQMTAEMKYAPQMYAMNAAYSPLYSQLELSNLTGFLNGTGGQPGFLSEYANQIMPMLTQAQTASNSSLRTANLADAARLTPGYIQQERSANPGAAGLLDTLTSNASRDLGYGSELTPAERMQLNQSVRGGQAARGMGQGPSDVFNESMANTGFGQQLYQQRQGQAQNLVPTLQSFYGDPTGAISGMQTNSGANAGQMFGAGAAGAGSNIMDMFNPQSGMANNYMSQQSSINMGNAQGKNAANQSYIKSGTGMASGILSGAMGGM